jgi:hypothetical protein
VGSSLDGEGIACWNSFYESRAECGGGESAGRLAVVELQNFASRKAAVAAYLIQVDDARLPLGRRA